MIHLVPHYDVHSNTTTFTKVEKPSSLQSVLKVPVVQCRKGLKLAKFGQKFSVEELVELVSDKSFLKDRRWPDLYKAALEVA